MITITKFDLQQLSLNQLRELAAMVKEVAAVKKAIAAQTMKKELQIGCVVTLRSNKKGQEGEEFEITKIKNSWVIGKSLWDGKSWNIPISLIDEIS